MSRSPDQETETCAVVGGRTSAPLLVAAFPTQVAFGILGRLVPPALRVDVTLELHRLSQRRALEILDRAGANAETELEDPEAGGRSAEGPSVARVAESARELARRIREREQELWRIGLCLVGRAPSPARAERLRDDATRRLEAQGFRVRVPRYEVGSALRAPEGVGEEPRPRGYWHTLHTDGVAAFFPFVDECVAEPDGVLVGLVLEDASPVFLNRWAHASHSWGIFGTTGSGKTFTASLLALRSRWRYPDLELIVVDPLGEFAALASELGGELLELGPTAVGRLNPLDPVSTGGDRTEKAARIGSLLRTLFPSLKDEEAAALDGALQRLYLDGPQVPTFDDLLTEVERTGESGRLGTLLRVLTEGSLRHLNGATTIAPRRFPLVVSIAGVPEDHRAFHLSYVLDWVHGLLRRPGARRLVVVDEAHLLVRDPASAVFLDEMVRHVRHFSAGFLLLSQHPEDFLRSAPGRSILNNLRATVLLRLASVSEECRQFFQLTAPEAEWLPRAKLPREAGYAEALLRFGAAHLPLAIVASTPEYRFLSEALGRAVAPPRPEEGRSGPSLSLSDPDRPISGDGGRAERHRPAAAGPS
ncbi:MAG TPA: DUF87 domain-containing protein [Thermoplasmata archaeon]|nr:DUF87 domain-containing protein [Thermoplasmata archaeon]